MLVLVVPAGEFGDDADAGGASSEESALEPLKRDRLNMDRAPGLESERRIGRD